jgi:hypothetical protein
MSEELSHNVQKLVELSKQIADAKQDIKVLVAAEKSLKELVKVNMQQEKIDTINLKKGKIALKKSVRKQGMNKKTVTEGLRAYFKDDEAQLKDAIECILECCETKESTSLSMTGLKEKTKD